MAADLDVVVVGAGAAGLGAARALKTAGASFVVLEAADRIGGRAWTDTTAFPGIPFDRGCHWLHSASHNPFRAAADALGLSYAAGRRDWRQRHLYVRGQGLAPAEARTTGASIFAAFDAMEAAGAAGRDVAASTVIDLTGPWARVVAQWVAIFTGADPANVSTLDFARYADTGEDWPVVDGFGALVLANAGTDLPIRLNTPARGINTSGAGVVVSTDAGDIRARSVIVTVSTTVLASGAIRFTPELPQVHLDAIAACPLGHAEKIAFQLDHVIEEVPPTTYADVVDATPDGAQPLLMTINEAGRPFISCSIAGAFGRDLARAGTDAMLDFGCEALIGAFGAGIRKRIVRGSATGWSVDPLVRGAYSCARPGLADLRADLARPVADRLFLAGEAVSTDAFSTAHGAHLTGCAAAARALALPKP
jgi:monoamine oxidase